MSGHVKSGGPKGEITRIKGAVSSVCGSEISQAELVATGATIGVQGNVGLGDVSDTEKYGYLLHVLIVSPSGNIVGESGNYRAEANGTPTSEIGLRMLYKACGEVGDYRVEVQLLSIDHVRNEVTLQDRGNCTFRVK